MVRRSKGFRSRTRKVFRKKPHERGLPGISVLLREYQPQDKVAVVVNPSVHKGMPHRRFHGKVGVVIGKRGRSYEVKIRDKERYKILIVRPEHLKPIQG